MTYRELLAKYPIISNQIDAQGLGVVLSQLENVLAAGVDGAVVELAATAAAPACLFGACWMRPGS